MDHRLFKCFDCGHKKIVPASDLTIYGRKCDECGGRVIPIGFVGVDLAKGKDMTTY